MKGFPPIPPPVPPRHPLVAVAEGAGEESSQVSFQVPDGFKEGKINQILIRRCSLNPSSYL